MMLSHRPPRLMRARRIMTIVYFTCCAIVLPICITTATVSTILIGTASTRPTPDKTAPFKQGNTTLFTTPKLLAWRDRLFVVGVPGTIVLLLSGSTLLLLRRATRQPEEISSAAKT